MTGLQMRAFTVLVLLATGGGSETPPDTPKPERVLVVVNGHPITEADLRFLMLSRKVPEKMQAQARAQLLQQLVDSSLLRALLSKRKVEPDQAALDKQVAAITSRIRASGDQPRQVLAGLGYTPSKLREELALPLMWTAYVRTLVTPKQLRDYWIEHKQQFDGTQVRAAQIVIKVDGENGAAAALVRLRMLRDEIVAGKQSFSAAAQQYSQSPSKSLGGDMGYFTYKGSMPVALARAAFALKPAEISEPFTTRFGAHLLTVTDRKPGQLSLEDARPLVFARLSNDIRAKLIKQERANAIIDWKTDLKPQEIDRGRR